MRKTDLNILFIGDSITNGEFLFNEDEQFWSLIHDRLLRENIRDNINVLAFCENGWTTRLALVDKEWQTAMRWKPEIAIIQFGLNDCNRWETDGNVQRVNIFSFKHNLIEMIQRLRSAGCEKIFLLNIHRCNKGEDYEQDAFAYSCWLEKVTVSEEVGLIDVRSRIDTQAHLLPDGIHLNRQGHIKYADTVIEAFGDLS